jgi:hypothetical protein
MPLKTFCFKDATRLTQVVSRFKCETNFFAKIFSFFEICYKLTVIKQILFLTIFILVLCFQVFGQGIQVKTKTDYRIDEYPKITWQEEQERLKRILLVELANHPDRVAYLIFNYQKNSELKLIKSRQKKISKFLQDNKIPQNRFRFVLGAKDSLYRTTIWLIPEGAEPP